MPDHVCHAGRSAFFGGRWQEPCPNYARHHIGSPAADPIVLCDEHFKQVNEAGMVTEPYLEAQEYERREQKRTGERPKGHRWFRRALPERAKLNSNHSVTDSQVAIRRGVFPVHICWQYNDSLPCGRVRACVDVGGMSKGEARWFERCESEYQAG